MAYEDSNHIKVDVQRPVAWVSIDYPPINLMDLTLRGAFNTLISRITEDSSRFLNRSRASTHPNSAPIRSHRQLIGSQGSCPPR